MKIEIKRLEIYDIYKTLNKLPEYEDKNKFFTYAIVKTTELLTPEYKSIDAMVKSNVDGFGEYVNKFTKIRYEHGEKDESGKLILDSNGNIKISSGDDYSERIEKYFNAVDKLNKKYENVLNDREIEIKEINLFMDDKIEIEIEPILRSWLPHDIEKIQMGKLMKLIIHDKEKMLSELAKELDYSIEKN